MSTIVLKSVILKWVEFEEIYHKQLLKHLDCVIYLCKMQILEELESGKASKREG